MAQIPAMLFASSGAGLSSHPAASASSSDFDAILAALAPHTQLPQLSAFAPPNEYASLHDYSALPSPKFENPTPAFGNIAVSSPAPTIPALKSSVVLPVAPTPVTTWDSLKPDVLRPAAPARPVPPAPPTVTWNIPPQVIAPIRPATASAPASASPVTGVEKADASADQMMRSAAAPLPSSDLAPLVSDAEATEEPEQAQGVATSPASAPPSKSSDPTQHQGAGNASTSPASTEASRTSSANSVAQQSPVRITPGTALPQHVVDAIMAAAADSTDLPTAAIPATIIDKAAQQASRPQTSNVKSAASGLPSANSASDRVAKTPVSANTASRVDAASPSPSKSAASGSQQPAGRGSCDRRR